MSRLLDEVVRLQKRGEVRGIPSICSAHPWVLRTALRGESPVLIESTCNQVNQFGGYTGMTPPDFVTFVYGLAEENGFPLERLILGGDHLCPSPWQAEPAGQAMSKAIDLVQAYVRAGFTKIHLDASMKLGGDDPVHLLDVELAARRLALLAKAAEADADPSAALRYVIGTEVPIPGGATAREESVCVTRVEDARRTIEVTQAAFRELGLESAWERVIAVVVQPGVEFGDDFILDYHPAAARDLVLFSETTPYVFEAHSTDYQALQNLRNLVRDHFAILKVGPALTYAFREAVFALALIEQELFTQRQGSHLLEVLEQTMLRDPSHWQKHYRGTAREQALARKYSLSDRMRYYWPDPVVQKALKKMLANLEKVKIPLSLLSQFAPLAYEQIRMGSVPNHPASVINVFILAVLNVYSRACVP